MVAIQLQIYQKNVQLMLMIMDAKTWKILVVNIQLKINVK